MSELKNEQINESNESSVKFGNFSGTENLNGRKIEVISSAEIRKRMKALTEKEKLYMSMMLPQYGVLFVKAKPGVAKSAMFRSIAKKMKFNFIDIRLSMADESDMQFPNLGFDDQLGLQVVEYAIPKWAVRANEAPTIVFFDEINRGQKYVRDAALKILLEREVGVDFEFNGNVFMACAGNLGEDDDTDVEEFDSALNNRLIHFEHELTTDEWLTWAENEGQIHPDIIQYVKVNTHHLYHKGDEQEEAYATPRTWEFLSKYIISNYGGGVKEDRNGNIITNKHGEREFFIDGYKTDKDGNIVKQKIKNDNGEYKSVKIRNWGDTKEYVEEISEVVSSYIGAATASHFLRYLRDRIKINIHDIVNNFKAHERDIRGADISRLHAWLVELKENVRVEELSKKQTKNLIDFLEIVPEDNLYAYVLQLVDDYDNPADVANVPLVINHFGEYLDRVDKVNEEY